MSLQSIEVRKLTPTIGAEITGVDFAVAEEEAAALVKRLREYHDS